MIIDSFNHLCIHSFILPLLCSFIHHVFIHSLLIHSGVAIRAGVVLQHTLTVLFCSTCAFFTASCNTGTCNTRAGTCCFATRAGIVLKHTCRFKFVHSPMSMVYVSHLFIVSCVDSSLLISPACGMTGWPLRPRPQSAPGSSAHVHTRAHISSGWACDFNLMPTSRIGIMAACHIAILTTHTDSTYTQISSRAVNTNITAIAGPCPTAAAWHPALSYTKLPTGAAASPRMLRF